MLEEKEQNSYEEKVKRFKKMGIDEVGGTDAVEFDTTEVGHLWVDSLCTEDGDLLLHLFWKEPPPPNKNPIRLLNNGMPAQDNYADWPSNFRDVMWEQLLKTFRLEDEHNRVQVEWIPELCSWHVLVKGVAVIMKPPITLIERIASNIVSNLSS